ncbi:MAG: apolipoprotein N-acyltransferase [Actinomycetota bacterium]
MRPSSLSSRVTHVVPVVSVVAAGGLTRMAFPDPGWWPLAPVAVAWWIGITAGRSIRHGIGLGLVYGWAFFIPLLSWSGIYVGALPWLALATLQALYFAGLGGLIGLVAPTGQQHARTAIPSTAIVAAVCVLMELLRSRTPFGGFPWGRLAFSQADSPFGRLAAWGGAPLVSFAVAWCAALLAWSLLRACTYKPASTSSKIKTWSQKARVGLSGVVTAVAVATGGLVVPVASGGRPVEVAGVQGGVSRPGLDFNAERREVLDNHARGTKQLSTEIAAGNAPAPDILIWPENASDLDPFSQPDARAVIDDAVNGIRVPTLVGAVLKRPGGKLSNASIVWQPQVGPGKQYTKRHPVPFGEYIPYRSFFRMFSSSVDLVRNDFVAGNQVGLLNIGPVRVGVAICFEVAYDDLLRDSVIAGADLLVVQTNNATFGDSDEAVQQLAMSRLRAIEHGRSVAHISTVGVSALIGPDGQEIVRTELLTADILQGSLPARTTITLADRLGRWVEWAIATAALLGAAVAIRLRRSLNVGRAVRKISSQSHQF